MYDEALDARVQAIVEPWGAVRKTMFGGTGYMLNGHLAAGVNKDRLVVRLSGTAEEAALAQPGVHPFDMMTRPMPGWLMVDHEVLDDPTLERWLDEARAQAESLPPK